MDHLKGLFQHMCRRRRNVSGMLAQPSKICCHIGGLLVGQAEVGHIRFRLHGSGRLDPMNQVLRIILKFAGNESPARHLIERRTDNSVGAGYSRNDMAGTATELLDDCLPALRGGGDLIPVTGKFLSSVTAGQQPQGCDHQALDAEANAHTKLRCESNGKPDWPKSPIVIWFLSFCLDRPMHRVEIQNRKSIRRVRRRSLRCAGSIVGLALGALLAGSALLCSQETSSPPEGQQIFSQRCARCHGERGEGISAAVSYAGPSLQAEHNAGNVMTALEVGPEHMPRFEYVLSEDQMRAVAEYVAKTLAVIPLSGGDLSEGGELYRTYCATCHRTAVRGGALGFVGTNAPSLEDKSAALVAGAIRWGPGPMPSFPPTVLTDRQLASIVDYVVAVQHPVSPGGNPMNWYGPVAEGVAAWAIVLVLILFSMWAERGGKG